MKCAVCNGCGDEPTGTYETNDFGFSELCKCCNGLGSVSLRHVSDEHLWSFNECCEIQAELARRGYAGFILELDKMVPVTAEDMAKLRTPASWRMLAARAA